MRMPTGREAGFTIIEISIFMAISGLLLLVAILGTSNSINTNRFNDSVRSAQGYLQKQYSDILNGVNPRDDNHACDASTGQVGSGSQVVGTSDCLLMGKLIQFTKNSSTFTTYYVIGSIPVTQPAPGLSDDVLIALYKPHVVPSVANETYNLAWGATVLGSCQAPNTSGVCQSPYTKFNSYLLLRSPASGNILSYIFYASGLPAGNDLTPYSIPANHMTANICLHSADNTVPTGMITLSPSGGQAGINTNFDSAIDVVTSTMCSGV